MRPFLLSEAYTVSGKKTDPKSGARRDRVFVSYDEEWDLERYIDHYLSSRKYEITPQARKGMRALIDDCPVSGVLRKSDLDYWLDAKVRDSRPKPT